MDRIKNTAEEMKNEYTSKEYLERGSIVTECFERLQQIMVKLPHFCEKIIASS